MYQNRTRSYCRLVVVDPGSCSFKKIRFNPLEQILLVLRIRQIVQVAVGRTRLCLMGRVKLNICFLRRCCWCTKHRGCWRGRRRWCTNCSEGWHGYLPYSFLFVYDVLMLSCSFDIITDQNVGGAVETGAIHATCHPSFDSCALTRTLKVSERRQQLSMFATSKKPVQPKIIK